MEPAEIIASVNRENAGLQTKIQEMEQQLFNMHVSNNSFVAIFQDQNFEICRANEVIDGLHCHIHFLQDYIAHVEQQSQHGLRACRQTVQFFKRKIAAERWSGRQWIKEAASLSTETRDLQKAVLTKIESSRPSDEQARKQMERITEIESKILTQEVQNNDLKNTLQGQKNRLEEMQTRTTAMIAARDDLNCKLNKANDKLRSKAGKNARNLSTVMEEKDCLKKQLANSGKALAENEETKVQLHKAIQSGERLQIEYQAALAKAQDLRSSTDFYKKADSNQVKVITSLQRKVATLQEVERKSGYTKTINGQKAEIEQLISRQTQLEFELQKSRDIVTKSLTRMAEQAKIAKEAKKEAAVSRGHALGTTGSLLDRLSQTNTDFAKDIVDTVFTMLKDLDSEQKAEEALAGIEGYLSRQGNIIYDFAKNVASNGGEVQDLIKDLQKKIPTQPMPKEVESFISYVRGLQSALETGITHPSVQGH